MFVHSAALFIQVVWFAKIFCGQLKTMSIASMDNTRMQYVDDLLRYFIAVTILMSKHGHC